MEEQTDILVKAEGTVDNIGERDNDEVETQYSQMNLLTWIWPYIKRRQNRKEDEKQNERIRKADTEGRVN
jgi:hypothetical protein